MWRPERPWGREERCFLFRSFCRTQHITYKVGVLFVFLWNVFTSHRNQCSLASAFGQSLHLRTGFYLSYLLEMLLLISMELTFLWAQVETCFRVFLLSTQTNNEIPFLNIVFTSVYHFILFSLLWQNLLRKWSWFTVLTLASQPIVRWLSSKPLKFYLWGSLCRLKSQLLSLRPPF